MNAIDQYTDQQLIALLNKGDRKAFELIYRTHLNDLYRFTRRNISVKEDCEEIIHEVFESLWARHTELKMVSIKAYLLGMVKHKVIRYFQHSSVKKRYIEHYGIFTSVYDSMDDEAFDAVVIQNLINRRISELPERYQMAIRLRLNESLSNGDIAAKMNVSRKTIDTYIFQAFSYLRTSIPKIQ